MKLKSLTQQIEENPDGRSYDECSMCGVKIDYGNYLTIGDYIFCGDKEHCSYHNNCRSKVEKIMKEYKIRYKPNGMFVRCTIGNVHFTANSLNRALTSDSKSLLKYYLSEKAGRRYPQKHWAEKFLELLDERIRDNFEIVEFILVEDK